MDNLTTAQKETVNTMTGNGWTLLRVIRGLPLLTAKKEFAVVHLNGHVTFTGGV